MSSATSAWYDKLRKMSVRGDQDPISKAKSRQLQRKIENLFQKHLKADDASSKEECESSEEDHDQQTSNCHEGFSPWIKERVPEQVKEWLQKVGREEFPFSNSPSPGEPGKVAPKWNSVDPYHDFDWGGSSGSYFWDGKYDIKGRPSGNGCITMKESLDEISGTFRKTKRNGKCTVTTPTLSLAGNFINDLLEGFGRVTLIGDKKAISTPLTISDYEQTLPVQRVDAYFKHSCFHGLARIVDPDDSNALIAVGRYRNGVKYGYWWHCFEGGGYLFGKVNRRGKMTGNELAYVFSGHGDVLGGMF